MRLLLALILLAVAAPAAMRARLRRADMSRADGLALNASNYRASDELIAYL
jgi:hypothetical protein